MQTSLRPEQAVDPELTRQSRFWRMAALLSVLCTANVFLGIVATILAQIAVRAVERGDGPVASAALRWARLLTLLGVLLSVAAALAASIALALGSLA